MMSCRSGGKVRRVDGVECMSGRVLVVVRLNGDRVGVERL